MKKKNLLFPVKYAAFKLTKNKNNKISQKITKDNFFNKDDIKKNFVLIKVKYANINFKDYLISKNSGGMIKKFPHTPGIDASGIVYYSNSKKFIRNDKVFIVARPLGIERDGSFSEFVLAPDNWVDKLPNRLSLKEIMMIGTSGFTAIKALNKAKKIITKNKNRPVLVSGATGNVGMFLLLLLKDLKTKIEVISSKNESANIFKKLGVNKIHTLKKFLNSPDFALLNEKYSVVFDNLGGELISACLKYLIKGGAVVSIGNILNNISTINILPFILREINILGINAEYSNSSERKEIFEKFKIIKSKKLLLNETKIIKLKDVPKLMKKENYKRKKRILIKI
tara:strand:+ start:2585 stop:3604 length:1020 start_codon:yes stop_codon:yes gene_type:complete